MVPRQLFSGPSFYFQFKFNTSLILTKTKGISKVISRTIVSSWLLDLPLSQNRRFLAVLANADGEMRSVLGAASWWLSGLGSSEVWPSDNHVEHEVPLAGVPPGPNSLSKALYYVLLGSSQTVFDNDFDTKGRPQLRHEVEDASSNELVCHVTYLGQICFTR